MGTLFPGPPFLQSGERFSRERTFPGPKDKFIHWNARS